MTNPTIPIPSSQKDGRSRPSLLPKTCKPSLYSLRSVPPTAFVLSSIQFTISHFSHLSQNSMISMISHFSKKFQHSHPSHPLPTDSCQNVGTRRALSVLPCRVRGVPCSPPKFAKFPLFPTFPKCCIVPIHPI